MTTGERIKKLREHRGLTQSALGEAIGESKQTIYKYESSIITNIPLSNIEALADALSVSPAYLVGWNSDNSRDTSNPTEHILFELIFAIPFMKDVYACCNKLNKNFDTVINHYSDPEYLSCLTYLLTYSSLKGNDLIFYQNFFGGDLNIILQNCLHKTLSESIAQYTRTEINIIKVYRTLPNELKNGIHGICGIERLPTTDNCGGETKQSKTG